TRRIWLLVVDAHSTTRRLMYCVENGRPVQPDAGLASIVPAPSPRRGQCRPGARWSISMPDVQGTSSNPINCPHLPVRLHRGPPEVRSEPGTNATCCLARSDGVARAPHRRADQALRGGGIVHHPPKRGGGT